MTEMDDSDDRMAALERRVAALEAAVKPGSDGRVVARASRDMTPGMIRAGVDRLRDFHFGQDEADIVEAIYLIMEIERRVQEIEAASSTKSSR